MQKAMWIVGGIWGGGFAILFLWAIYYRLMMMGNMAPGVPWWKNNVGFPELDPTLYNPRGEMYRRKLGKLLIVAAAYFVLCAVIMMGLYEVEFQRSH